VAPTPHLAPADIDSLVTETRIERYGAGETMQTAASVPDSLRLILAGRSNLRVALKDGSQFTVGTLSQGDYIGQTALTRERVAAGVVAIDEVTVLRVPVASMDRFVHRKPELARDIGKAIGQQRLRATPEPLADVAL
jgi:CRP-like cAMP-binding protein